MACTSRASGHRTAPSDVLGPDLMLCASAALISVASHSRRGALDLVGAHSVGPAEVCRGHLGRVSPISYDNRSTGPLFYVTFSAAVSTYPHFTVRRELVEGVTHGSDAHAVAPALQHHLFFFCFTIFLCPSRAVVILNLY